MSDPIGDRLAEARGAKGLTQKQLAEEVGIDALTLSRYERGVQIPSLQRLAELAVLLGVDRSWLTDGLGRGPSNTGSDPQAA